MFSFSAPARKTPAGENPGAGARIPGQQINEKDRET